MSIATDLWFNIIKASMESSIEEKVICFPDCPEGDGAENLEKIAFNSELDTDLNPDISRT